jgi:uncharacterized membrane protein
MMWLDAMLAYLHFTAIFTLFAFLSVELVLLKDDLTAAAIRRLGRAASSTTIRHGACPRRSRSACGASCSSRCISSR